MVNGSEVDNTLQMSVWGSIGLYYLWLLLVEHIGMQRASSDFSPLHPCRRQGLHVRRDSILITRYMKTSITDFCKGRGLYAVLHSGISCSTVVVKHYD